MTITRNDASRPHRLRRIISLVAAGAVTTIAFAAAPTTSWATVDENQPTYQEPNFQPTGAATQVYSLQLVQAPPAAAVSAGGGAAVTSGTAGTTLRPHLTVSRGATSNAEPVTTWTGTWSPDFAEAEYLQSNQLWEFLPATDNPGGTLSSGYGLLRNRDTGKCLQVNGATTEDAAGDVNQWDCIPTAHNEQWKLVRNGWSGWKTKLMARHSGDYLGVNGPSCSDSRPMTPDGNGQRLTTRDNGQAGCAPEIVAERAAYAFATNKVDVPLHILTKDNARYECLDGYGKRFLDNNGAGGGKNYGSLFSTDSSSNIGYLYKNLSEYGTKPASSLAYNNNEHFNIDVPFTTKGQILIPCYPK